MILNKRFLRAPTTYFYTAILVLLAFTPPLVELFNQGFYLDVVSRIMILAIAALSLNLLIGLGGMVSFGHAAYIGIGAYSVGIPAYYGIYNGFVHLGLAIGFSALFALVSGAISLRTKGVYFIMITLAFAQMLYFTFVSLDEYGGDDGLVIELRSDFGSWINLENNVTLFYLIFAVLLLTIGLLYRLSNARFGRVILGAKFNEPRMQSLGYPTYRYRLICYIISGVICGIAGTLLANFSYFISPDMMDWSHSGELIFMVVLGGVAALFGPLLGAAAFLLLEEWLSNFTVYWQLIFGMLLIGLVLYGKQGIHGVLGGARPQ